jgi:ligand-binding sensor domain-containing protein
MKNLFISLLLTIVFCQNIFSQQWTVFNSTNYNCTSIAFENDTVWVGSTEGVIVLDSNANFIVKYTISDGLIDNTIKCVAIDKNGNKWFGSNSGVSVFNGLNWITYNSLNGLVSNAVNTIAADSIGNVWVGTNSGISMFDGNIWTTLTTQDGLVNNHVNSIAIDSDGNKWFGTSGGVSMFDDTKWTTYTPENGLASYNTIYIAIDKQGNKWFSTKATCETGCGEGGGICSVPCSYITKFDGVSWTHNNFTGSEEDISPIVVENQDSIWYIEYGCVNNLNHSGVTFCKPYRRGFIGFQIFSFAIDKQGNKWFGTECGISKFNGKNWFNFSNGISFNNINSIALDWEGNKWLGTVNGILKYNGKEWSSYIPAIEVNTIDFDPIGNLWCGTGYNGVYMYDGNVWTNYTKEDGLLNNDVNRLSIDSKGNKWFLSSLGLSKFDGINWTNYTKEQISSDIYALNDLEIANEDTVYLATDNGLYWYDGIDGHTWVKNFPFYTATHDLTTDAQNNLWLVDVWGISKFSSTFNYITNDGLDLLYPKINIDINGNVWAKGKNGKVLKYDGSYWNTFVIPNENTSYLYINYIKSDLMGNIWIGTAKGLWMLYDNTVNINFASKNNVAPIILYSNPVIENLTLITPDGYVNAIVDIYDMSGQKIFSTVAKGIVNKINLSNSSSGVYVVKLTNRSGVLTQKFIKL